jgi:hypothetical protein
VVFPGTPVSATNKTDRHDITELLLKVTLNAIKPIKKNLLSLFFIVSFISFPKQGHENCIK